MLYILLGLLVYFALPHNAVLFSFMSALRREPGKTDACPSSVKDKPDIRARYEAAAERYDALPFERVFIRSAYGKRLAGDFYDFGKSRTAIIIHGYRATPRSNCILQMMDFIDDGWNVLNIHPYAHGASDGTFSSMGYREWQDIIGWIEWVKAETVVVYGISMSGFALARASSHINDPRVRALIVDCGYTSYYKMMSDSCRKVKLPTGFLIDGVMLMGKICFKADMRESSEVSLKNDRIPTLFVHGLDDPTTDPNETLKAYEACGAEKEIYLKKGAAHAVAYGVGGEEARRKVFGFIDKHTKEVC